MPEGRFISKSISCSGQLKRVSLEADFLFGRMIPHLDRDGRLDGDPDVVKATACPLRSEMTPELITTCLAELDTVGVVEWYEVDGQKVLWFPAFAEHQQGMRPERERPSRLPSHEAQGAKACRRTKSGRAPDKVPTNSPQVKLSQVKSSEVKIPASGEAEPEVEGVALIPRPKPWNVDGAEVWSDLVAPISPARLGAALKPMQEKFGWPDARNAMLFYIESTDGKPRRVEWLAADAVRCIRLGKMQITDPETGLLTERGKLAERDAKRSA